MNARATHDLPGSGLIEVATVAGRPAVTRMRATAPLKLLAPRHHARCASVFTSTFGGGLVAGDHVDLRFHARAGTICWLGTQASTKVYKSRAGVGARQTLHAIVERDASLFSFPDPVACFAGARYEQRQRFDVEAGGGLVALDWYTSGRKAHGERWAFDRYSARTDVHLAGDHVLADAILLDAAAGPLDSRFRTGGFDCFATLVVVGEPVSRLADHVLAAVAVEPLAKSTSPLSSASPLRGGAVLRIAGDGPESVARYLRRHLSGVEELLGDDPWARKW
jgi:urease accessory protein